MAIRDLKQWHWIIIGIVVGGLLVYLQLKPRLAMQFDGVTTMDPKTFANSIGQVTPSEKLPMLRKLVVYPPHPIKGEGDRKISARQIVTGEVASETHHDDHSNYIPFLMFAPIPFDYSSKIGLPGADYSVRDLLDHRIDIGQRMTPYRYAWWATTPMTIALWGGGSVLLIGGVWPMFITFLSGGFWGKQRTEAAYDLNRFAGETNEPQGPDVGGLATGDVKIEDVASPTAPGAGPASAVKELDTQTLAPLPTQAEGPHHYQGEFYPVERAKSPPRT